MQNHGIINFKHKTWLNRGIILNSNNKGWQNQVIILNRKKKGWQNHGIILNFSLTNDGKIIGLY